MAAHQLTLCQKYEDIEGLILLWGSSLPMQLNLSFILLLTPRQSPPSDSPALVSHLLPFIVIGRPPYSKEGQCLANSPTDMPVGELPERTVVSLHPDPISAPTIPWNTTDSKNWGATSLTDYQYAGVITECGKTHNNISPGIAIYGWHRIS